jgi:hypothetical protein
MRLATGRALDGDNLAWLGVAGAAWLLMRARRRTGSHVFSIPMNAGDRVLLSVRDQLPGEDASGHQ